MAIFRRIATIVAAGTAILLAGGSALAAENSTSAGPLPAFQGESRPFVPSPDRPALPALTVNDANGQPIAWDGFKGKVLLINLWATWCAPCIKEMPSLDKLQGELGGDRFQVVAISVDRAGINVVKPFFEKAGIQHLPVYLDQKMTSMKAFPVKEGLPLTILVDAKGNEVGRLAGGAHWDSEEAKALIRKVMAQG
jgi:thiol-disulfide isomerase/thioredoxin